MPNYKSYPTKKNTPKRKMRKAMRRGIFRDNQLLMNQVRKARKEQKRGD